MSIWRSITCKCGCGYFDVADNGLNDDVRLNCRNCDEQIILERQSITLENLLLLEMKKINDKEKGVKK